MLNDRKFALYTIPEQAEDADLLGTAIERNAATETKEQKIHAATFDEKKMELIRAELNKFNLEDKSPTTGRFAKEADEINPTKKQMHYLQKRPLIRSQSASHFPIFFDKSTTNFPEDVEKIFLHNKNDKKNTFKKELFWHLQTVAGGFTLRSNTTNKIDIPHDTYFYVIVDNTQIKNAEKKLELRISKLPHFYTAGKRFFTAAAGEITFEKKGDFAVITKITDASGGYHIKEPNDTLKAMKRESFLRSLRFVGLPVEKFKPFDAFLERRSSEPMLGNALQLSQEEFGEVTKDIFQKERFYHLDGKDDQYYLRGNHNDQVINPRGLHAFAIYQRPETNNFELRIYRSAKPDPDQFNAGLIAVGEILFLANQNDAIITKIVNKTKEYAPWISKHPELSAIPFSQLLKQVHLPLNRYDQLREEKLQQILGQRRASLPSL